ncbi:hypothetical protein GGS21DRAFT_536449 [Xylaria nigripes]|nr:hypothetical protein GGS21DRAFT_536449 [Xylaria nigripes]
MSSEKPTEPMADKKLVLCFDGTGNAFSGSSADTNVVKILNKLDRLDPHQFHYYQTGIGTYDINETSINKSVLGELHSRIAMTIDEGIGNTFDAHVKAGYRFLMQFYESNTKIYMFGFSRGAFTARFLARMVNTVGLLCKGNEELVPFAYALYRRYLAGEVEDFNKQRSEHSHHHRHDDDDDESRHDNGAETNPLLEDNEHGDHNPHGHNFAEAHNEITAFSNTFCRKELTRRFCPNDGHEIIDEENIKVYFLGIWDCVNSVAPLERRTPVPVPVKGTARYVRHAVSVDERRVKFRPALLSQDKHIDGRHDDEDLKEVWFPGCHGDVGGGWPAEHFDENLKPIKKTLWQRITNIFRTSRAKGASKDVNHDPFQMSDIPLAWMIRELELVGKENPAAAIKFSKRVKGFEKSFQKRKGQALRGIIHDSLSVGSGTSFIKVLFWNFLEWFPFITRYELNSKGEWENWRFPLNCGNARDIPKDAVLHSSLIWRLKNDATYQPKNNHGGITRMHCLSKKAEDYVAIKETAKTETGEIVPAEDPDHQTYHFADYKEVNGSLVNGSSSA